MYVSRTILLVFLKYDFECLCIFILLQVIIYYPSKQVKKRIVDELDARLVRSIACEQREAATNAIWCSTDLKELILQKVERDVKKESTDVCSRSNPSCLSNSEPESLICLKDSTVVKELQVRGPILHRVLKAVASGKDSNIKKPEQMDKVTRAVSIASSVLFRCRTPSMSALAYRLSILMWHGGAEKQVYKY